MSIRRLMASAAGGLVVALAAVPIYSLQAQGNPSDLNADSKFIREAAGDNVLEIRLGQLAQKKATNPSVKQFGQQMVTAHTTMLNQWVDLVKRSGTSYQPSLNSTQQQEFERLDKVSSSEFDRTYMATAIQDHQNEMTKFQSQGQTARSAEVRALVASGLPTIQQHLTQAQQVGAQVGATSDVAISTPTTPTPTNPGQVNPQPGQVATQGDVRADAEFLREAAGSNLLEVRLGQLASGKTSSSTVRQFAQRMVTDHTNLQQQLTSMASSNGFSVQPNLNSEQQRMLNRLQQNSGAEFDRAYMSSMIQMHQTDVNTFQTQAQSARSNPVRQLAAQSLPILQQHLSLAMQVGNQVGADTTGGGIATGNPGGGNQGDNQGGGNQGSGSLRADATFVREIAADNKLFILVGQLAQRKAQDSEVKRYGARMASEHTRMQGEWNTMASNNGMQLKPSWGPKHQQKVDRLEKLSGKQFDRQFMTLMIQQHQDNIEYFQKEGREAKSAAVRNLVNKELPDWKRELSQAKNIGDKVGINVEAALRAPRQ